VSAMSNSFEALKIRITRIVEHVYEVMFSGVWAELYYRWGI